MPSRSGDPDKRGQARLSAMFKYAVQILPSLSSADAKPAWKNVYEGELPEYRSAVWDAKREVEWIKQVPRQYGNPVGVRAVVAGEVVANENLWTK